MSLRGSDAGHDQINLLENPFMPGIPKIKAGQR